MSTDDVNDIGFKAQFSDPYSLRCLIDYLRLTITEAKLVISSNSISIFQGDKLQTILHRAIIDPLKLTLFQLNKDYEEIAIGINMADFSTKIKGIQKKNSTLQFYNSINNSKEFYVSFMQQTGRPGIIVIPVYNVDSPDYRLTDYEDSTPPNFTVPTIEISRNFSSINALKCDYAVIECYKKGMFIKGIKEENVIGIQPICECPPYYLNPADRVEDPNNAFVVSFRISSNTVKALCKINTISPASATTQIYFDEDKPFKLKSSVGTYGTLETYLSDIEPKTLMPSKSMSIY